MVIDMDKLLKDLSLESEVLIDLLDHLDDWAWNIQTPAEGWTIQDQVSHLAYFDNAATLALKEPDRFNSELANVIAYGEDFPNEIAKQNHNMAPDKLLEWFKSARTALISSFHGVDPRSRLPWYGPDMSAASSITARLMETWAHGVDIADALGVRVIPTNRLFHIAHLGYATMPFAHLLREIPIPQVSIGVELIAPDGSKWTFGPPDPAEVVSGDALDFCLVVTQRRNLADTTIITSGPNAANWMQIAQAFASTPGPGRKPTLKEESKAN
ncbi:hypothetical protein AXFE_28220 [Acidithrix ferrooxidans]|uniref:Mycothiol-dependent maleylpyruvate isomerase metal-binding domain-containing protein n=2 Tax=Acidithrix ferrooxidans TaxID=1280514 RepID=A0A0D8HEK0_9ACTN|nr:hypothetical protein AXFE_28220 [Acidithrix ferrooxidans]